MRPMELCDTADRPLEPPPLAPRDALFLDADGTLLEIAPRPDLVAAAPGLVQVLERLARRFDGALAFVSGRLIADLDRIFTPLVLPAAGAHGLERRRADGTVVRHQTAEMMAPLRVAIRRFADATSGLVLEDKALTVSLHYRLVPEQ